MKKITWLITLILAASLAGWGQTGGQTGGTRTGGGAGGSGSTFAVNGTTITNATFSNTTPSAVSGGVNVLWQTDGTNVSAYMLFSGLPAGIAFCSQDTLSPCLTFQTGGVTLNGAMAATSFASTSPFNAAFSFTAGASGAPAVVASTIQVQSPGTPQVAGYNFVLPAAEPTANQALGVASISSHVAVGKWISPGILGFGATFDGGGAALSTGTAYITIPYGCTISAVNLLIDQGAATFTVWKIATGTALPTVGQTDSTAGLTITGQTASHSTNVSDFISTTVTANDIAAIHIVPSGGATWAQDFIECDRTY